VAYLCSVNALYHFAPGATLYVFILPFIIISFLLMFGNWCQHIFVDPSRYDNSYALTYNIINSDMNKLTYNDGYHIVHHLHSQLHWSELPNYFIQKQDKFLENRSLTFEGVEYLEIGLYVFMGWYDNLWKHYVQLEKDDNKKITKEQFIEMIKNWLTPIQPK
jgi:fatty acid desaturase